MKCLIASLFLLLPTLCFGQGFGSFKDDQPFLAKDVTVSGEWTPQQWTNIYFWWVSSDLAVGSTVDVWTESIGGKIVTNQVAGNRPTNAVEGVWFSGSTYLTNNPYVDLATIGAAYPSNCNVYFCTIKPITPASDFAGVIQGGGTTPWQGGYGLSTLTGNLLYFGGDNGSGTIGSFTSGNYVDIVMFSTNTLHTLTWTNGIYAGDHAWGRLTRLGAFGAYLNLGRYYKGYIGDVGGTTNTVDGLSAFVSLYHNWSTNKYGFSP